MRGWTCMRLVHCTLVFIQSEQMTYVTWCLQVRRDESSPVSSRVTILFSALRLQSRAPLRRQLRTRIRKSRCTKKTRSASTSQPAIVELAPRLRPCTCAKVGQPELADYSSSIFAFSCSCLSSAARDCSTFHFCICLRNSGFTVSKLCLPAMMCLVTLMMVRALST